jgi:hypothetical protein
MVEDGNSIMADLGEQEVGEPFLIYLQEVTTKFIARKPGETAHPPGVSNSFIRVSAHRTQLHPPKIPA